MKPQLLINMSKMQEVILKVSYKDYCKITNMISRYDKVRMEKFNKSSKNTTRVFNPITYEIIGVIDKKKKIWTPLPPQK